MKNYVKPDIEKHMLTTEPIASLGEWLENNPEYGTEDNITTFEVVS